MGKNKMNVKRIKLKKSPNNKLLPPRGKNVATKTGDQVSLGNMLKPVEPESVRVVGHSPGVMAATENLNVHQISPK